MALDKWTNNGLSTLASGIDASQTTATLATGTGSRFPADTFNVVIWNSTDYTNPIDDPNREIVRCTSRAGDVLTVTRAQESTLAVAHNTAGKTYSVALIISKKFRDDISLQLFARVNVVVFTGNGTYTKPSNLLAARVIVIGPGGNGGAQDRSGSGGGGGAGSYSESLLLASAIGATVTVTVPAGGSGLAASFGALVIANAGGNASLDAPGPGGVVGTGQIAILGSRGNAGRLRVAAGAGAQGASGAAGPFGGAGNGSVLVATGGSAAPNAGAANSGAGGGGAGGNIDDSAGATGGGAGGSAIVIVQEFLPLE